MNLKHKNKYINVSSLILLSTSMTFTGAVNATMASDSNLSIDQGASGFARPVDGNGSWFAMEALGPGGWIYTGIGGLNNIDLGVPQAANGAPGANGALPADAANGNIDNPWVFFGSTGAHQTTSAITVLTDDTTGLVTMDFTGWDVSWNNVASISMGGDPANYPTNTGIATITCANTCENGDTYVLDYSTNVPDVSVNFPGVAYELHLEGTITVPNTAPVGVPFTVNGVARTTTRSIPISSYITDTNYTAGNAITISNQSTNLTSCGTVADDNGGNVIFPADCVAGTYTFSYSVKDDLGLDSDIQTGTVILTNTAPVTVDFAENSLASSAKVFLVATNASDADTVTEATNTVDAATVSIVTDAASGSCTANTPSAGQITFTTGTVDSSCTYTVNDTIGTSGTTSNTSTISITIVTAETPLAANDSTSLGVANATIAKNGTATIDVLDNDSHPDGLDAIATGTVAPGATAPSNGNIGINGTSGVITYTPTTGFAGTDTFTYTVDDQGLNNGVQTSNEATVTVIVTNVSPAATDSTLTTATNTAGNVDVTANVSDADGTVASITAADGNHGTTTEAGMVITYTPATGFSGPDSFTYTATDDNGVTSSEATITVTVTATAPSVTIGTFDIGSLGLSVGSTNGTVTTADVGTDSALEQQCIGGCFDFAVTGLTNNQQIQVVLPLSADIPAGSVYRKLIGGNWQDFTANADNNIKSAAATATSPTLVCPASNDSSYTSGLTEGNRCLLLTMNDGGPNDADGISDGVLTDPGGLGIKALAENAPSSTEGCSITNNPGKAQDHAEWLIVSVFIGVLGWFSFKRRSKYNIT